MTKERLQADLKFTRRLRWVGFAVVVAGFVLSIPKIILGIGIVIVVISFTRAIELLEHIILNEYNESETEEN